MDDSEKRGGGTVTEASVSTPGVQSSKYVGLAAGEIKMK